MNGPYATSQEAAQSAIDGIETGLIETGLFDTEVLDWLAGWEPSTVTSIAGLIRRARQP